MKNVNISNATRRLACLLFALPLFFLSSCKKFIDVGVPRDQVVTTTVFSDDATAVSAMLGLYSNIMDFNNFLANGGITICAGLTSDEIYNRNSNEEDDAFRNNSISPSSGNLDTWLWSSAYTNIYHVNAILEGLANAKTLTPAVRQQLTGEAKFIRALYYFYLTNLFGDVPLIVSTDFRTTATSPKLGRDLIYDQIISDLNESKDLLTETYPVADRIRPNKWAASALLARVYLYHHDWAQAENESSSLINAGAYDLPADLNQVFLLTSNEVIFQLAPSTSFNATAEGLAFVPGDAPSSRPAYLLTTFLLDAFEPGDKRRLFWVNTKTVNSTDYHFAYKYKIRSSPSPANEANIVLRLAEQFLIRAEARAQQGNITDGQDDLNVIRARAGLPPTAANSQNALLSAILHERRTELFAEWGHRWFDLIRTGNASTILGIIKAPNWQDTDTLYPIPLSQLKLNAFLTQNPGY